MVVFCFLGAKLWQKFARALDLMILNHCAILRCHLPVDVELDDAISKHVSNTTVAFVPISRYLTIMNITSAGRGPVTSLQQRVFFSRQIPVVPMSYRMGVTITGIVTLIPTYRQLIRFKSWLNGFKVRYEEAGVRTPTPTSGPCHAVCRGLNVSSPRCLTVASLPTFPFAFISKNVVLDGSCHYDVPANLLQAPCSSCV